MKKIKFIVIPIILICTIVFACAVSASKKEHTQGYGYRSGHMINNGR